MTDPNVKPYEGGEQTPSTLLERVKVRDQVGWERLVRLYSPLVYRWCRRAGLQEADAADVGQEVFQAVARGIGDFHHDRAGDTFGGWLRTITQNKIRDFKRGRDRGDQAGVGGSSAQRELLEVAADSPTEDSDAEEDTRLVYRRAVEIVLGDLEERTRLAFWRVVIERRSVAEVARDLNMTRNAIYLVKSRTLRRIRDEFAGLLDV